VKRDFKRLKEESFDVLVVGGGIYGAWCAYDAALRGLKVALIDKSDWAGGTSSASTKLIHGGLRYLEHLRLDLVHTSLEERKRLALLSPHMVQPLKFFVPIYDESRVGPLFLKTGLVLYDLLAGKGQPVPGHQSVSRRMTLSRYPFLKPVDLERGFTYGDCQMDDARFALDVVRGAAGVGAVAVNYVRATKLLMLEGRVAGAHVADQLTQKRLCIKAKVVVNTAGPWISTLGEGHVMKQMLRLSKGVHLVMPALPTGDAMLLMTRRDNRVFFMVPWYGRTLLGTSDADYEGDPDKVAVTARDVDYLLGEANRYLGDRVWDKSSVLGAFAGLRALVNQPGKSASDVSREWSLVEPKPGLMVSIGGKYTSARADAAKMVDRIAAMLDLPPVRETPTATRLMPSAPTGNYKTWRQSARRLNIRVGMDAETANLSIIRHGTAVNELRKLIRKKPSLARRIVADLPFCRAEIVHCAINEMVVHLDDLLRRRIPIMILMQPDQVLVQKIADQLGPLLGWNAATKQKEIENVMGLWPQTRLSE
jgi:glycerol-3-phosphate dehydrogenase